MKLLLAVVILCVLGIEGAKEKAIKVKDKDMMRKMIIYDKVCDWNNSTVLTKLELKFVIS